MGTNTGIGIGIGIPFKNNVLGEGKPYLPPEIKDSLKAVVIAYGKTNNDSDRAIVKNLVDASNPFVISNAAFKLNSGFGKYEEDFTDWKKSPKVTSFDGESIKFTSDVSWVLLYHPSSIGEDIPSFKVRIKLYGEGTLYYSYITQEGTYTNVIVKSEIFETPICYNTKYTGEKGVNVGFTLGVRSGECSGTITQIPSFEGAFVTDGIDDLIKSTKSATEMLDGSNEVTVVSMIHQIKTNDDTTRNNWFFTPVSYLENRVVKDKIGKTGIYGYTSTNVTNAQISDITPILGDKNDYTLYSKIEDGDRDYFTVEGFQNQGIWYVSSIAWYWTIIANKVLTTDQINQVIAYFNLDRTLKPDILCNTIKQGITNENHAEFGDKLIDFSGNGRDIQLNNLAWDGDSGIGKYNYPNWKVTATIANTYSTIVNYPTVNGTYSINVNGVSELMQSIGLHLEIKYTISTGIIYNDIKQDGVYSYILPDGATDLTLRFGGIPGIVNEPCNITITQIPSHAGALCLDGVNDFGKVTGMPIYKDYTVVTDREIFANIGAILSKNNPGAFVETAGNSVYSFGQATSGLNFISTRSISYLSKYSYCGQSITAGAAEDGTDMWLGTIRDNDSRFFNGAIYSLMSFPYSMSEFLIERQLKKHKLGTLYPDMVEFRPVITTNTEYNDVVYYAVNGATWTRIYKGEYIPIGQMISITINLKSVDEISKVVSSSLDNISIRKSSGTSNAFDIVANITSKSPQKIDITIDEYIRFEDIVQPYPILLRFNDENGNEVSWGGKFKVGSTITRIGSIDDPERNLLNGLYSVSGLSLNGKAVTRSTSIVEKQMVFKTTTTYLLDNNEPKCILSPSRLRIPNSSYKLLGYIPDISGHGNHGVIHNSAYAEGSGVNEDGSYQFDGVDDHITIPTLSSGGKQVLMKVNWNTINSIIYDQRGSGGFAIYCSDYNNPSDSITVPAYKGRNAAGTTYIDGIRNEYIIASQLRNVTHNIVEILDTSYAAGKTNPIIGKSHMNSNYGSLALYDFMLFDNISTDDKIKELNEYVGIEAKVELPPYYWDAYGKSNLDEDRDSIKQRGVAVGDYDLTNTNFAYDKMSGYGGYEFAKFDNTLDWYNTEGNDNVEVVSRNGHSITLKRLTGSIFWYFQNSTFRGLISNVIPFKVNSNKNIAVIWDVHGLSISEGKDKSFRVQELVLNPNEDNYTNLKTLNEEELAQIDISTNSLYYLLWFDLSTLAVNEEVTIEMLPLYPNGLLYDAVTDYSENVNIPVFTDFTAIMKRKWLKNQGCPLIKGSKVYEGGNGNALLFEWDKAYNFVFYKRTDIMEGEVPENISFITPTNYNGNVITRGSEQDTNGICIAGDGNAGFANMVFYKLILYPKTIPLLQINFLKNLMEKDEIIDLTNPIFIKNE